MKHLARIIFILLFCVNLAAQKNNVSCPFVDVKIAIDESTSEQFRGGFEQTGTVCPDNAVIFTAEVRGLHSKIKPTFKWIISDGEIISGQGTSSIKVQTNTKNIEATVKIIGLPKTFSSCPMRFSKTVEVAACCLVCTTASIKAPDLLSSEDRVFTAKAILGDPTMELTYEWAITDGVILEGQGTNTIKAKCLGLENCTVGFDLKGMPPECPSQVSKTIEVRKNNSPNQNK